MIAGLALLGFLVWSWWQSRLPGRYDVMSYGAVDDGGAQPIAHNHFGVDSLTGPTGKPDYKVTLTAEKAPVRLASGQVRGTTVDNSIDVRLAGEVSETTRATIARATDPPKMMALSLGSPEFQRR